MRWINLRSSIDSFVYYCVDEKKLDKELQKLHVGENSGERTSPTMAEQAIPTRCR